MAAKKTAAKPAPSAAKNSKAKKAVVKVVPKKAAPKKAAPVKKLPVKAAPSKAAPPKVAPPKVVAPKVVPAKVVTPKPAPVAKAAPAPKLAPSAPEIRKQVSGAAADRPDDQDSDSLLAGPRNVKPYVPKRGEQYMNKEQLEHFRTILSSWKQDLMLEVDRTVSHMKDEAANFPDPNDRATQEEEFSLELRTRDRERKLIRKIDEALGRIEDGTYGYCLETGEQIGVKRLEARPVATLSLEAQERRERREKQYGDRDDRYR
jgi:DnaK suppressor protein